MCSKLFLNDVSDGKLSFYMELGFKMGLRVCVRFGICFDMCSIFIRPCVFEGSLGGFGVPFSLDVGSFGFFFEILFNIENLPFRYPNL